MNAHEKLIKDTLVQMDRHLEKLARQRVDVAKNLSRIDDEIEAVESDRAEIAAAISDETLK